MAQLDFPSSPTSGQIFVGGNGVSYQYNGTLWLASGASAGGDFCASLASVPVTATEAVIVFNTVVTGNTGSWYSTSTGRYTPPAGRYSIFAEASVFNASAAQNYFLNLRKNGTLINGVADGGAGANFWANPSVSMIVDANGTDFFDVTIQLGAGTSTNGSAKFMAYPISGIKGPPGDPPTAGTLTAQSILLHQSTVSSPVNTTATVISWDTVTLNTTGGTYSAGSFTVPANMGGVWDVQAAARVANATPSIFTIVLVKNSVTVAHSMGTSAPYAASASLTAKMVAAAGDVIRVDLSAAASSTVFYTEAGTGIRFSWLHLTRVGA